MARGIDIHWEGVEKLGIVIKRASSRTETLAGQVVRNNGQLVQKTAVQNAPVDSGFLKGQIKASYPGKLEAHIKSEASYAGYQEHGTRFQSGTPHIRPALKSVESKFTKEMNDVMNEVFK